MASLFEAFRRERNRIGDRREAIELDQQRLRVEIDRLEHELRQRRDDLARTNEGMSNIDLEIEELGSKYFAATTGNASTTSTATGGEPASTNGRILRHVATNQANALNEDWMSPDREAGHAQQPVAAPFQNLQPLHKNYSMAVCIDGRPTAIVCGIGKCRANVRTGGPLGYLGGLRRLQQHMIQIHGSVGISLEDVLVECSRTPITAADADLIKRSQHPTVPMPLIRANADESSDDSMDVMGDEIFERRQQAARTAATWSATSPSTRPPARFDILDRADHPTEILNDGRYQYVRCHKCGANATAKRGGRCFQGIVELANHYRQAQDHGRWDGSGWSDEGVYEACDREDVDTDVVRRILNNERVPNDMVMDLGSYQTMLRADQSPSKNRRDSSELGHDGSNINVRFVAGAHQRTTQTDTINRTATPSSTSKNKRAFTAFNPPSAPRSRLSAGVASSRGSTAGQEIGSFFASFRPTKAQPGPAWKSINRASSSNSAHVDDDTPEVGPSSSSRPRKRQRMVSENLGALGEQESIVYGD